MGEIKKLPTVSFIRNEFTAGRVSLPPVVFTLVDTAPTADGRYRSDYLIEVKWNDTILRFIGEIKTTSTPKDFMSGIALFKTIVLPRECHPLLITPFLSPIQLQILEQEGINGVDMCGNGVINIARKITVFRTGQPNRFPSYAPIKNIYRKNCSIVSRVFFSTPRFAAVNLIVQEIANRDRLNPALRRSSVTLGTISKALAGLEDDLIIERGPNGIALIQPDVLLENLTRNFTRSTGATTSLKVNMEYKDLPAALTNAARKIHMPVVATGLSSVGKYAVMVREEKLSVYCPDARSLLEQLEPVTSRADRFPNLEITVSQDATAYFDSVEGDDFKWASPLQTYLELMTGDKRDQETAQVIKNNLILASQRSEK